MLGEEVSRSENEFARARSSPSAAAIAAYRARGRGDRSDGAVAAARRNRAAARKAPTSAGCLLHLINETARHAGHADATRELLDGTRGE